MILLSLNNFQAKGVETPQSL